MQHVLQWAGSWYGCTPSAPGVVAAPSPVLLKESSSHRVLSTTHSQGCFFHSSPDNQRWKGHTECGLLFLSRKVRSVCPSSTEDPCSDDLMKRTWWAAQKCTQGAQPHAQPLLLANQQPSVLLLFHSGLLRQVQICFQITLGYVAGKFSLEAATTRNSSCLSMLYRTGSLFYVHLTVPVCEAQRLGC